MVGKPDTFALMMWAFWAVSSDVLLRSQFAERLCDRMLPGHTRQQYLFHNLADL
jgi:hypothetical protein